MPKHCLPVPDSEPDPGKTVFVTVTEQSAAREQGHLQLLFHIVVKSVGDLLGYEEGVNR